MIEQKNETDLLSRLNIADGQIKALTDAVAELQKNCEWYQKRIDLLENQLTELQKKICTGNGLKRRARRESCVMKSNAACTSCGDCEQLKNI